MITVLLISCYRSLIPFFLFLWADTANLLVFLSCWDEESLKEEGNGLSAVDSAVFLAFLERDLCRGQVLLSTQCRLGIFENPLCHLEHFSSEMKIVGICADQSGIKNVVKGDLAQQEGSQSLAILSWDSHLLCVCPGHLGRPGKHFSC